MNDICLHIQQLSKRLATDRSLGEINLSLKSGKRIALLGVNGAGKSSFIRLLVGEDLPDTGSILYQDKRSPNVNLSPTDIAFKNKLGYQADTMLAIDQMTGDQYLQLCGLLKGFSSTQLSEQIEALNNKWPIDGLLDRPMSKLSKGNLQKLAIAQALLNTPKFMFFDEPCQSLDPLEQEKFNQLLKQLTGFELCIFSTHNVEHALQVADEIILFHHSKITYHFKNIIDKPPISEDVEMTQDFILACREGDLGFEDWLQAQELDSIKLSCQIYKIRSVKVSQQKNLKTSLKTAPKNIDFCLSEKEALLPLFRMLASGELTDFCLQEPS